jgi:hypothetical protein
MDAPYRIEKIVGGSDRDQYLIYRTGDGHVITAFDFRTARQVVDALNELEVKRALQRVA